MPEINVKSWERFEQELERLESERSERASATGRRSSQFLFRGQYNPGWPLTTTLERRRDKMPFADYFRLISRVKPQVETFTGRTWNTGDYTDLEKSLLDHDPVGLSEIPAYSYMVYLRHHGFPSPLLDWTRSPYIAAYFAFREPVEIGEQVSIYLYWAAPSGAKRSRGNEPFIRNLGPYVRSHRRHFLQQSEYTMCLALDDQWRFWPHREVFERRRAKQDLLWKFNIPSSERVKVLKLLDKYNLNAFSLFESDESLIETMAIRELDFREAGL
jgi:hypothetical protein